MAPKKLSLMGRSAALTQFPESAAPAIRYPNTTTPPPASGPLPRRARHLRRRIKNPPFPGGRRSGPSTPLLRWKLNDVDRAVRTPEQLGPGRKGGLEDESATGGPATAFSARNLAAALWHLQVAEVGGGGLESWGSRRGFEPNPRHLHFSNVCGHDRTGLHASIGNEIASPISPIPKTTLQKLGASATPLNFAMERATKWDAGCLRSADEVYRNHGHSKPLKDQMTAASVISVLQAELEQACSHINELKNERQSAKKKVNHFLKKLADEKASWQSREHEKVRNIMEAIKDDLNRVRKSRKRIEIMNSKLVNELAEAKLSAKQYLQDFEKERKARELIEEVCNELAKEIGEDKAEAESLKRESMKIREELDEERRMLQMAEVWREERVQLKLVDAKITLEEKYAELIKLQADIDAFLRDYSSTNANMSVLKEAEMLREAVSLLNSQDIKFHYQPPPSSGDIFSVVEELQPREEANEREIEQCCGYSPASHASKIHTVSPETDIFLENPMKMCENGMIDRDEDVQDDSGLETMSYAEGQGSCNSPEGNDPSANGIHEESHATVSGTDWDMKSDNGNLNSEISEVCSRTTRQSRKKVSSIGKFWRSSRTCNGNNKNAPVDLSNGKLLNGGMWNATLSPDMNSGGVASSSPNVEQQRSSDSINSHINRGIKESNERPREKKNRSLKTKLLEAKMENQKIQLRHVLKHKS